MLVKIDAEQLAVGMYLHAIDLPWHRHPFWRRRFVIHSREEVASLIAAGAKRVTIDDEKGLAPPVVDGIARSVEKDVREPETQRKAAARSTQAFQTQQHPARLTGKERAAELRRATKILAKSKSEVMRLFDDARMGQSIKTGKVQSLVDQISDSVAKDASIILNIARLKSKDEYTFLHSVSVCALMINLGRKMGLDEAKVRELGVAGNAA
jgi:HD-GYP domain-containing protein (c-di-GMP phosphodiesterase class II)